MPLSIGSAVLDYSRCALRNLSVINPTASIAPFQYATKINLWGGAGARAASLRIEDSGANAILGVMLSKTAGSTAAAKKARKALADGEAAAGVSRYLSARPNLAKAIDTSGIYSPVRGRLPMAIPVSAEKPEPIILVANPKAKAGQVNIIQTDEKGNVIGGYTLVVLP